MTFKNGFFYDSVFDVRIGLQLLGRYQFLYGIFYRIGIGVFAISASEMWKAVRCCLFTVPEVVKSEWLYGINGEHCTHFFCFPFGIRHFYLYFIEVRVAESRGGRDILGFKSNFETAFGIAVGCSMECGSYVWRDYRWWYWYGIIDGGMGHFYTGEAFDLSFQTDYVTGKITPCRFLKGISNSGRL